MAASKPASRITSCANVELARHVKRNVERIDKTVRLFMMLSVNLEQRIGSLEVSGTKEPAAGMSVRTNGELPELAAGIKPTRTNKLQNERRIASWFRASVHSECT